jgi:hypothetical protein
MTSKIAYNFNANDLIKVLEFTRDYHLEESKQSSGRTNQGSRNFGGELDAFIPGKLIELGVCKILERYSQKTKELYPDYKIYTNAEVANQVDPDIVHVKNNDGLRDPNIHVEIKRLSDGDEWLGMRADQLKRVEQVKGITTVDNMYMIHASLKFHDSKNKKQNDVVGAVLKELIPSHKIQLNEFSDFSDLHCEINYVYSINDLKLKGNLYSKGEIIPTGSFLLGAQAYKSDASLRKGYEVIKAFDEKIRGVSMEIEGTGLVPIYGEWEVNGKFDLIKTNHNKKVIFCKSNVTIFNNYFGHYFFEEGKTYNFYFKNKLGNDFKNIDDYWFFKKRLDEMMAQEEIPTNEMAIKKIIALI